ncbi:MAG TPA: hypothetical protein VFC15_01435 [Candidatus Limnocylindrales bacterium]|jgi:hypothetical protein|nr:hypothetical protein [Candidatus Limnocylindrales bacterium]
MFKAALLCLSLSLLVSCSSEKKVATDTASQPAPKPVVKAAQYDTGRTAFQRVYLSARLWAADAKPFRLQSQFTPDAPTAEGKSGMWRASFASPSKRMMKLFVWSGLVGPDAPEQGISFSAEDSWSASNSSTQPFDMGFLKVDSDKAYEVAQKNGGDKLTKKDPKQPVIFVLSWDATKNQLIWHVLYGDNPTEAKLRLEVDATTGEFLRVEK